MAQRLLFKYKLKQICQILLPGNNWNLEVYYIGLLAYMYTMQHKNKGRLLTTCYRKILSVFLYNQLFPL